MMMNLKILKVRAKPLRWLICDVMSSANFGSGKDSKIPIDLRFDLRSSRELETSKIPSDLLSLAKGDDRLQNPIVGESFRFLPDGTLKRAFVRSCVTEAFRPTSRTRDLLNQHFTQFEGIPGSSDTACFFESLVINLYHVTEWNDLTPQGGFSHSNEKMEIDCQVPLDWANWVMLPG